MRRQKPFIDDDFTLGELREVEESVFIDDEDLYIDPETLDILLKEEREDLERYSNMAKDLGYDEEV